MAKEPATVEHICNPEMRKQKEVDPYTSTGSQFGCTPVSVTDPVSKDKENNNAAYVKPLATMHKHVCTVSMHAHTYTAQNERKKIKNPDRDTKMTQKVKELASEA